MKKILLVVAFFATTLTAQLFAQDVKQSSLLPLLTDYYNIKDALINSNSSDAAAYAGVFLKDINGADLKSFSVDDRAVFIKFQDKLAYDARHISESTDIAHQREHFANFSANFFKLVKSVKLTNQVVYYDYCPMQNGYWLSAYASIKNPYLGKQMLTCGKVTEALNK